uniref:C-CAP/cofactor C-like domain-containing protein n=1 Tax=Plectus sambesii TaxID=2011161 RepID=A0A914W477_9BILA
MSDLDDRRSRMLAKLNARNQKPSSAVDASSQSNTPEKQFNDLKMVVEQALDADPIDFQAVAAGLERLQELLSEQSATLSAFDSRKGSQALAQLRKRVDDVRKDVAPTKSFAFRKRQKQPAADTAPNTVVNPTQPISAPAMNCLADNQTGLKGGAHLRETLSACADKDVLLSDLTDSEIRLGESPSTLHLVKLRRCTVIAPPVRTSVFVDDCEDVTLVVACQQLRMHGSRALDVYMHVTSGAIIERCRAVRVAPYSLRGLTADAFDAVGLHADRNQWDKVDDFDWLAADKPSPNWSQLPIDDRKTFSIN